MKHFLFLASLAFTLLITNTALAQESVSIPDTLKGWQTTWTVGLNGSQASYSNWSQGGTNNIAATGTSIFTSLFRKNKFGYGVLLDTRYGRTRIEDEGTRKIADRLYLLNRLLYTLNEENPELKLFANFTFRTQFDEGFEYGEAEGGGDLLISSFMAPAYFSENIGLAYIPSDIFKVEAGIGLKQWLSETGITFGASIETDILENVQFSSNLETFSNFSNSISSTDIYFSNQLIGRVNSYINTNLSLDLVYDDDFSDEIQVAQILSLGISYSIR